MLLDSDWGLLLGKRRFGELEYTGTIMVRDVRDDDFIGLVFGYQSNRHYYLLSWKTKTQPLNVPNITVDVEPKPVARAGISLKKIHSKESISERNHRNALWETASTRDHAQMIWFAKNFVWKPLVIYRWKIIHNPSSGRIRVFISNSSTILIDSSDLYDTSYRGGYVGMYTFSQEQVYFSNLKTKVSKISDYAVHMDGISSTINLGPLSTLLKANDSFAISVWARIHGTNDLKCDLRDIDFGKDGDDTANLLYPFTQSTEDELDWTIQSWGTTTKATTGPTGDHTTSDGTGNFIYLAAAGKAIGDRASLVSHWFKVASTCTFSFWYHMFCDTVKVRYDAMGSLRVEIQVIDGNWELVWSKQGNQGNAWRQGGFDMKPYIGKIIRIRFTGAKGDGRESDMALDDIKMKNCADSNDCNEDAGKQYIFGSASGKGPYMYMSQGKLVGGASRAVRVSITKKFDYGDWAYFSLKYDKRRRQVFIRFNESQLGTSVSSFSFDEDVLVGGDKDLKTKGTFDEFRVWSATNEEARMRENIVDGSVPGLYSLFNFNDGEGTRLREQVRGGFAAKVENITWVPSSLQLKKIEAGAER